MITYCACDRADRSFRLDLSGLSGLSHLSNMTMVSISSLVRTGANSSDTGFHGTSLMNLKRDHLKRDHMHPVIHETRTTPASSQVLFT